MNSRAFCHACYVPLEQQFGTKRLPASTLEPQSLPKPALLALLTCTTAIGESRRSACSGNRHLEPLVCQWTVQLQHVVEMNEQRL